MSQSPSTRGSLALRIRDVAKRFGSAVALDGASLELRRGERLALLRAERRRQRPRSYGASPAGPCPDSGEIECSTSLCPRAAEGRGSARAAGGRRLPD